MTDPKTPLRFAIELNGHICWLTFNYFQPEANFLVTGTHDFGNNGGGMDEFFLPRIVRITTNGNVPEFIRPGTIMDVTLRGCLFKDAVVVALSQEAVLFVPTDRTGPYDIHTYGVERGAWEDISFTIKRY